MASLRLRIRVRVRVSRRRRRQREAEEAVAFVLHTARSWAQLRASPADRPQSEPWLRT